MLKGLPFWLVWVGFGIYAFVFAPPDRPDTIELIQNLIRGDVADINPTIVALFNLMGVYPLIFACLLFSDGHGQKAPAWLFVALSMGVGAFALLPYFALRESNPKFIGQKNWWVKLTDSRITGLVITIATIGLLIYGFKYGNWSDFLDQWQTNRFIHVMSLDFLMLSLLFPWILGDDMSRRGLDANSFLYFVVASIPLLGAVAYLTLRPNIVVLPNSVE